MRAVRLVPIAMLALSLALHEAAEAQSPDTDIFVAEIAGSPGSPTFSGWRNVTRRAGYDNQPGFTTDSRAILYTAQSEGQTDIYRYDLTTGRNARVTNTPESEYSATMMPGGTRFSVIRVEADSTQRLWSFALDGSAPELVLADIAPVGYHAWLDDSTLGLFVLGRPATLQIADTGTGRARVAAHDIGRSLHRVPGRSAVSYLHRDGGGSVLRTLDPISGRGARLIAGLEGSQDYAWTPHGVIIMGSGSVLYAFDPLTDADWRRLVDLSGAGISEITRLAISPDGTAIAVVADGGG